MNQMTSDQRRQILECLGNGNKIEAIKTVRGLLGCDLREAKEFIEALQQTIETGEVPSERVGQGAQQIPSEVHDRIVQLIGEGKPIDAIRIYRDATGAGLKQSKAAIDRIAGKAGLSTTSNGCGTAVLALSLIAFVVDYAVRVLAG